MSENLKDAVNVSQPKDNDQPKPLKPPPKKRTSPSADKAPRPDRTNLWVAMVGLLTAIIVGAASVYQSSVQTEKLRDVSLAIRDTEDIRSALRKPLEGVWHYELRFKRYFGQGEGYVATGTAILIWEPERQHYQVYIGYSVSKEWAQEKLVTAFVNGTLQADELGWPREGFEMQMKYLNRTGIAEFSSPLAATFTLTQGGFKKSEDGKYADKIFAHYENPRSSGDVLMHK